MLNQFHLTSNELNKITTSGRLILGDYGDSHHVDHIYVRNLTHNSGESRTILDANTHLVQIWEFVMCFVLCKFFFQNGDIFFEQGESRFRNPITAKATGSIYVNASVYGWDTMEFIVDSDCIDNGTLQVGSEGFISTHGNDTRMHIIGGSVQIDEGGRISAGFSSLNFTELCTYGTGRYKINLEFQPFTSIYFKYFNRRGF